MSLAYRATPTYGTGYSYNWSVPKQSGTASGDIILIFACGLIRELYQGWTAPSGFSKTTYNDGGSYYSFTSVLFYRTADGTEGSSFSIDAGATLNYGWIIATISGAVLDPSTPPSPNGQNSSTSLAVNSITLGRSNEWVLWFAGSESASAPYGNAGIGLPSGFTERTSETGASSEPGLMLGDKTTFPSGATGTQTGSTSLSYDWSGVMVGLAVGEVDSSTSPSAISAGTSITAPSITNVINQDIAPSAISSGVTVPAPSTQGGMTAKPGLIASITQFGTTTLTPQPFAINAATVVYGGLSTGSTYPQDVIWEGSGFGLDMPTEATASSLAISIRHYESDLADITSLQGQLYVNDVAVGSPFDLTPATAARTDGTTFTPPDLTISHTDASTVKVRVTGVVQSPSVTIYIDWALASLSYSLSHGSAAFPGKTDSTISIPAPASIQSGLHTLPGVSRGIVEFPASLSISAGNNVSVAPSRIHARTTSYSPQATAVAVRGTTLSGLQGTTFGGSTFKTASTVESEILASQNNFGANTVRLQIQQQMLVGPNGNQYDSAYNDTVNSVVQYALDLGMTVVINCTTEGWESPRSINYPNQNNSGTDVFWSYLVPTWNANPNVIFDIFNEPDGDPSTPGAGNWSVWQTAMQNLINYMRNTLNAVNTLWADADNYAASLSGCPGLSDPNGNLVYSFHHPSSGPTGDTSGWDTDFGNWAQSHAVVNGEFAQNNSFNWNSPYEIQQYLNYLDSHSIGQTLWVVHGDNYFSDSSAQPYGWWGNMIANRWIEDNGWKTYCFRSSVEWYQNYLVASDSQISLTGMNQGWDSGQSSMLASAAGFGDFTSVMTNADNYRVHVAFECTSAAAGGGVTAVVGVHQASGSAPSTWTGCNATTDVVENSGDTASHYYQVDIPSSYHAGFADGTWKGITFGPGPDSTTTYQGVFYSYPEVVIEVHSLQQDALLTTTAVHSATQVFSPTAVTAISNAYIRPSKIRLNALSIRVPHVISNTAHTNPALIHAKNKMKPVQMTGTLVEGEVADSLILGGSIELLGGGVQSDLPQCPGAIFKLQFGYDLGSPQPTTDVIGALLLDGERPYGRRASNRTLTLPIVITVNRSANPNADRAILSGAREALLQIIDQPTWTLVWTREGGYPLVLDCFRAQPTEVQYNAYTEQVGLVSMLKITFQALPYGHSDVPVSVTFDSPASGYVAPPSPVVIDDYSTVSLSGWDQSSHHITGPYSCHWTRVWDDFATFDKTLDTPVDISDLPALSFWFGIATDQDYWWWWHQGNVIFSITFYDGSSQSQTFGVQKYCHAGDSTDSPHWQLITTTIPYDSTIDYTTITRYVISCWTRVTRYQARTMEGDVYIDHMVANPISHGTPASTRGTVYTLFGVQGTSHAPLNLQFQHQVSGSLADFKTLIAHRPGPDAPQSLTPFVDVGDGSDTPDGREYTVSSPLSGVNARFNGTYTVIAVNFSWNSSSTSRTATVTVKEYEYSGGPSVSTTVSRTFTPDSEIDNGIVVMGEMTLPVREIPGDNSEAYFTVGLTDTNTSDRWMDVLFLDTTGQTLMINGSGTGYINYYLDEPTADRDLGLVLGSSAERSRAVSVLDWSFWSGGPLTVEPGDNTLLCYAVEGAPSLVASYYPRWYLDRLY